jgi:hypothetical protein
MDVYADRMKAHLTRYKRERLGVLDDGIYKKNGNPYSHILPERLRRLNILESIRREFWQFVDSQVPALALHRDFHHLNSSQAFAFNLFFPWTGLGCAAGPLLSALQLDSRPVRQWTFECMPDAADGTVVDLHAEREGGARLLIDVKLTEGGFSGCDPDERHQQKLLETYSPRLTGKVTAECLSEPVFFPNYQLLRNVSRLETGRGDMLILVVPRANEPAWQQGNDFCRQRLAPAAQPALKLVAVEDVLSSLTGAEAIPYRFRAHLDLLCEKYLPTTL